MKYFMLGLLSIAAACGGRTYSDSAAGNVALATAPTDIELANAYTDDALSLDGRINTVAWYVSSIEERLPADFPLPNATRLTRTAVAIPLNAFADVTDEQFDHMEMFYDGADLKRIRTIPLSPETGTEEFYYNQGKLVFVSYEADGATKSDPHPETNTERYYFGAEGLIAWIKPDGTRVEPSSAEFKQWSAQLLKEADRFAHGK